MLRGPRLFLHITPKEMMLQEPRLAGRSRLLEVTNPSSEFGSWELRAFEGSANWVGDKDL